MPVPRPMPRWKEQEYKNWRKDIRQRLLKGREYFASGEYSKAQAAFESVLKRDPQNTEAMRLRKKVMQRMLDRANMELEATRKGMIKDVRQTWNPRDYGIMERELEKKKGTRPKRRRSDESDRIKILNKMKAIKIPEVDFRQANIRDVIQFLQDASVEYDPEPDPAKKTGVNIILNLGGARPGAGAPPGGGLGGEPGVVEPGVAEAPPITFTARYISLLEALKIVTDVAGLKYRIEGSVVIIVPLGAPDGPIIVRMYDVNPTAQARIDTMRGAIGGGGGGGGSPFAPTGGGGGGMAPVGLGERGPWKEFFGSMGVK